MSRRSSCLTPPLRACTLGAAPPAAPEHGIGSVHTDISCGADANARYDRGLALLHNFWYERALTDRASNNPRIITMSPMIHGTIETI